MLNHQKQVSNISKEDGLDYLAHKKITWVGLFSKALSIGCVLDGLSSWAIRKEPDRRLK